jgi:homoserine dehydrogenase
VRGVLSGTVGFVSSGLELQRPFSELVREAIRCGYAEPDFRLDLSGMDVARKALIIARTLGWRLELGDVEVEDLLPAGFRTLSRDECLARLHELDAAYAERAAAAAADGRVLRYVAELCNGRAAVGMRAVPADSAVGRLRGTDNLVAYHTRCYSDTPLVLQGRGAGADAAAAGVHGDIVALAGGR